MKGLIAVIVLCVLSGAAVAAPVYIGGAPDWDQPVLVPGGPALGTGWNAWCVPAATANIAGYYRDLSVSNAIGDAQVFPNTAAWPAADFQDDSADALAAPGAPRNDIGWYMSTNDLGQTASGANAYIGTMLSDVKPGLDGIDIRPGWKGYFPDNGVNVTVTNAAVVWIGLNTAPGGPFTVQSVWPRVTAEVDASRPILGHFTHWGIVGRQNVRDNGPVELPSYDTAGWGDNPQADPGTGESYTNPDIGHTVTIVGYWPGNDPSNPFYDEDNQSGPNAIIVHDNKDGNLPGGVALPLVLPFDATAPWVMNTEVIIPEPTTITVLLLGLTGLLAARRIKRD